MCAGPLVTTIAGNAPLQPVPHNNSETALLYTLFIENLGYEMIGIELKLFIRVSQGKAAG